MKCPGQDLRFWRPEDVFEVACQACGTSIEFFRDDPRRRCPKCGTRVDNPRIRLGCAQWCAYAKACLGFDPQLLNFAKSDELPLMSRLIEAVKDELGDDQQRLAHALEILGRAQELLHHEPGSPRVVMAAVLLGELAQKQAPQSENAVEAAAPDEILPIARRILNELEIDQATIEEICRIVCTQADLREIDTQEARIIWDATRLVDLPQWSSRRDADGLAEIIVKVFRTETGKETAHKLFVEEPEPKSGQDSGA